MIKILLIISLNVLVKEEIIQGRDLFPRIDSSIYIISGYGSSIRVDREGYIWVMDVDNHRLMKYDGKGEFLKQIGSAGQGPGEFMWLCDFTIRGDKIYVAERNKVKILDKNGREIESFGVDKRPIRIGVDSKGLIYLSFKSHLYSKEPLISIYSSRGKKIDSLGFPLPGKGLETLFDIDRKDNIWLVFKRIPIIRKYDASHRILFEKRIIERGRRNPYFMDITVQDPNHIYLLTSSGEVYEFDRDGNFRGWYILKPENPSQTIDRFTVDEEKFYGLTASPIKNHIFSFIKEGKAYKKGGEK